MLLQDLTDVLAGTYELTVTDSLGCTEFISIDVSEPLAPLSVILNPVDVLCFGNSTGSIDARREWRNCSLYLLVVKWRNYRRHFKYSGR